MNCWVIGSFENKGMSMSKEMAALLDNVVKHIVCLPFFCQDIEIKRRGCSFATL